MKMLFSVLLVSLLRPSVADAIPVLGTATGQFSDGGTLNGSFLYDANVAALAGDASAGLSSIDFITAGGDTTTFPGRRYGPDSLVVRFQNEAADLGFLLEVSPNGSDGRPLLTINIKDPGTPVLSNLGGGFNAFWFDWDEYEITGQRRRLDPVISGRLIGTPLDVAEPTLFGCLGVGSVGLFIRRLYQIGGRRRLSA